MTSGSPVDDLLACVASDPGSVALFCDFDGTLAPIVPDPAAARPLPGASDALAALARRLGRVAIVSGRPLDVLDALLPAVDLAGLYGLERRLDGVVAVAPGAERWRPVVDDVAVRARAAFAPLAGVVVEPKGLSLTLHWRQAPSAAAAVAAWGSEAAAAAGLEARPAKASIELHPPVATDKGTVITDLVGDCTTVVFVGDDVGDLAAFDALARLGTGPPPRRTVAVAVGGAETPPELLRRADLVVDGPAGVLALLQRFVTAAS